MWVFVCCHPIYSGPQACGRTSWGHTVFLHLPPAVLALMFIARRIQPLLSLVDRAVESFVHLRINRSPLVIWHDFCSFLLDIDFLCEEKSRFVGLHRNSNSHPNVRRFRGYQLHHRADQRYIFPSMMCAVTILIPTRWLSLETFLGRSGPVSPLYRLRFSEVHESSKGNKAGTQ